MGRWHYYSVIKTSWHFGFAVIWHYNLNATTFIKMKIEDYRARAAIATNGILDLLIAGSRHMKKLHYPLNFVIKVNALHLVDGNQAAGILIDPWCDANCKSGWSKLITHSTMGFENEQEAMLFKLTWG